MLGLNQLLQVRGVTHYFVLVSVPAIAVVYVPALTIGQASAFFNVLGPLCEEVPVGYTQHRMIRLVLNIRKMPLRDVLLEPGFPSESARKLRLILAKLGFIEIQFVDVWQVRRLFLLFKDRPAVNFAHPRMKQYLLDATEASQSQLLILMQKPPQEILQLFR